jgi:hypothetical protein
MQRTNTRATRLGADSGKQADEEQDATHQAHQDFLTFTRLAPMAQLSHRK